MVYSHIRWSATSRSWARSRTRTGRATRSSWRGSRSATRAPTTSTTTPSSLSLINANSPLVWDATMLGAARVYARANQATLITPFILAGAMSPVTVAGTAAQTLAEALAGMAFVQLVRPGAPVILGSFASLDLDAVGSAHLRDARAGARAVRHGRARAAARRAIPLGRQPVRREDRPTRRRPTSRAATFIPTILAGTNFVLHAAGWLEGGLVGRLREVHPRPRPVRHGRRVREGRRPVGERPGARCHPRERPGHALPRQLAHARQLRDRVLPLRDRGQQLVRAVARGRRARVAAAREQDLEADARRVRGAAHRPGIDEALLEYIAQRKAAFPDSDV